MENDAHSVRIDIPKPRVSVETAKRLFEEVHINRFLKRSMAKRYRRPVCEFSLQKYSLPWHKPLTSEQLKKDELLVPLKTYTKNEAQDKHKQKLTIKYYEKYKVIQTDFQRRLHVSYPPDDVKALTDIDKECYNYVNGRTIPDHVPLFKSLKFALANLLRIKEEIGIRKDGTLKIDLNCWNESKMYEACLKSIVAQAKYFDNFISEDYRKSMDFLSKWDNLISQLHKKHEELQSVATEQFTIMSRLIGLDYLYSKQQKYGRFLYYLSPPSWRAKNREFALSVEIAKKGFDLGYSSEEETFNVIYDKMQKEFLGKPVKPVMYFTNPHELLDIFDGIEKHQLDHFAYVTHKKMLNEGIVCIKEIMAQESALVANIIQGLEKLLEFSDERCVELETKFFKILSGLFYESVGTPEVLKLFVHLEFCYERVFGEKPMNLDIVLMAKALEDFYMFYWKRLDAINSNTINTSIAKYVEKERRMMRRARVAARELRLFDILERDLLRAHKPAFNASRFQTFLPAIKGAKPEKSIKRDYFKTNIKADTQKLLDESEVEYLSLFTDWTVGDDPTKYLHRLEDEQ